MAAAHCPDRGDVVWLAFDAQAGHEQAGRRPALTLSPAAYNRKSGLALFCPITTKIKGYPFEVALPDGLKAAGVVLSDQIKSLDWRARDARLLCKAPSIVVERVLERVGLLLS
jgi:mRNA interferase MazF